MTKFVKNVVAALSLSVVLASMSISASAMEAVTVPDIFKNNNSNLGTTDTTNDIGTANTNKTSGKTNSANKANSVNSANTTNNAPEQDYNGVNNSNTEATQAEEMPAYSVQQQTNSGQLYVNEPLDNSVPVIYKYEIQGDGYITPGEEFKLKFMVYNPAVVSKLGNIRITVSQEDNLVYPTYEGTNSVYLGYLNTLSYAEGEVRLTASKNITEDEIVVYLTLNYTDNYARDNKASYTAVLPVSTSAKLNIDNVEMPTSAHVGGNNRIKVSYSNNSLSAISDLVLHLEVADMDEQTVDLGRIGSGYSLISDVYAEFATAGDQNVNMRFTYSDESGQEYESEIMNFSVSVEDYDDSEQQAERSYLRRRNIMNKIVTIGALIACLVVLGINGKKYFEFRKFLSKCKRANKKVK